MEDDFMLLNLHSKNINILHKTFQLQLGEIVHISQTTILLNIRFHFQALIINKIIT